MMPAFATTTSTGPSAASISVNAWSTDAASVTSARTVSEPSGPSPERAVTATRWPWATNSRAIAYPMPRLPPVTRTVRLVVMMDSVSSVLVRRAHRARPSIEARGSGHPSAPDGRRLEGEECRATHGDHHEAAVDHHAAALARGGAALAHDQVHDRHDDPCRSASSPCSSRRAGGSRSSPPARSSSPTSRWCSRTSAARRATPRCSGRAAWCRPSRGATRPSRRPSPDAPAAEPEPDRRRSRRARRRRRRRRPTPTIRGAAARRARCRVIGGIGADAAPDVCSRAACREHRDLAHRLAEPAHPHR